MVGLVVVALLAGCSAPAGLGSTRSALTGDGIKDPTVTVGHREGTLAVEVAYTSDAGAADQPALAAERATIERDVWQQLAVRVGTLSIKRSVHGGQTTVSKVPRADLEARLGPRPAGLDHSLRSAFGGALIVVLAVVVVLVGLLVVWFMRSSARTRRRVAAA